MADDQDDQIQDTEQDVADDTSGGLPETAGTTAPDSQYYTPTATSAESAGPPPVPEKKRTREEEIAKQQVDRDATGQKSVLNKIQGLFTGEPDTFGIGAAAREGMAAGDRNDPLSSAVNGIRDWLTGKNASSKADLSAAIQRANPDGSLDPSVATHKAIAEEQDPVRKDALMGRAMHTYREARAHARAASDNNHWDQADAFANEGMNYLPDGTKAQFTRHGNGVVATVSHLGTDKQDVINLTPQQYSAWLHSDASDADTIMRTGLGDSLRQATAQQRGGEGGPSMAGAGVGAQQVTPNTQDIAARAQERRVAEAQGTSFEKAADQLDTAQRGGFATQPLELRRDAEGNLWTKDPTGKVIPYTQTGMKYATGEPVPSHTQGLDPAQARDLANQPPVQPGPQNAAVRGMPASAPVAPPPKPTRQPAAQSGGNYNTEGQQVQPQEEEPAPRPQPPAQRSQRGFHRRGHRRQHNQGA